jgi:hypothetical protein
MAFTEIYFHVSFEIKDFITASMLHPSKKWYLINIY